MTNASSKNSPGGGGNHRPGKYLILAGLLLAVALLPPGSRYLPRGVTLALLGDINMGRGVTPAEALFEYIEPEIRQSDLSLANLESPLTRDPKEVTGAEWNLCTGEDSGRFLQIWGIAMVSLANNHRADCGQFGEAETARILQGVGITPVLDNAEPVFRQVNGVRLAFLAFDDILKPIDEAAAVRAIRSARERGAVVVVSMHWGVEYQADPTERQERLAKAFAEAGAGLIWGHHPHVLQRMEWLETQNGRTLVLYSLGNALFDQGALPDTRQSALALVRMDTNGALDVTFRPFVGSIGSGKMLAPDEDANKRIIERLHVSAFER